MWYKKLLFQDTLKINFFCLMILLTLSWRGPLPYRNQSTDLQRKSMDWFLYDNGLRHERVKLFLNLSALSWCIKGTNIFYWLNTTWKVSNSIWIWHRHSKLFQKHSRYREWCPSFKSIDQQFALHANMTRVDARESPRA